MIKIEKQIFIKNNYSFCLFRIPKDGGRVIWEITNRCNYSCSYCIFNAKLNDSIHSIKSQKELTYVQIKKALDELKESGYKYLKITGGEPFIRNDIFEILLYARQKGFKIDISTNASLITKRKAKLIKDINIDLIHVSLDGHTRKIHELVRGKNTFFPTIEGIKNLIENEIHVRIGCVIFKGNEKNLEDIIKYSIKIGAKELIFSLLEPVGRMRNNYSLVTSIKPGILIKEINQLKIRYLNKIKVSYSFAEASLNHTLGQCPAGIKFLYINHEGLVSPCTWISEKLPEFRSCLNLKSHSFLNVLKSERIQSYIEFIGELEKIGISGCPVQSLEEVNSILEIKKLFTGNFEKNMEKMGKFSSYSKIYSFTTEKIAEYFLKFNFKDKKILTVGGSCDHLINAYFLGAKRVTCFDINILSKYYSELKIAALKKFKYKVFLNFFMRNSKKVFSHEQYLKLRELLSLSAKYFFDSLYKYFEFNGSKIRESVLFNNLYDNAESKIKNNLYLLTEENYQRVSHIINSKKTEWIKFSIQEIIKNKLLDKRIFDLIFLSNIADYLKTLYREKNYLLSFKSEIVDCLLNNISNGGKLCLAYIYKVNKNPKHPRSLIDDRFTRRRIFKYKYYKYKEIFFPGVDIIPDSIAFLEKKHD